MMVVIDEKHKNQIFYFPTKKSQPTKVSIREAIWHFPPHLHRVQRFEMWSIECEEESLAVCVKILFSGPLLRAKFTATIWIFYVFSFPVLQRCFGEMEWRKVSRKKLWKASQSSGHPNHTPWVGASITEGSVLVTVVSKQSILERKLSVFLT